MCRDQRKKTGPPVKQKLTAKNPRLKLKNGGQKMNKLEKGDVRLPEPPVKYEPLYVPTTARNIWINESLNLERQKKSKRR